MGCYSHRVNLCVIQLLNKFEHILRGVNDLMQKLGSMKKSAILRKATPLRPITRNYTRWSSTFMMLKRYLELKPFIDMNDIDMIPYLPSVGDDYRLKSLLEELEKLESISKNFKKNLELTLLMQGHCLTIFLSFTLSSTTILKMKASRFANLPTSKMQLLVQFSINNLQELKIRL